jgi:hypothetical protein
MILVDQMLIVNLEMTPLYVLVLQDMLAIHLINDEVVRLNLALLDLVAQTPSALQTAELPSASAQEDTPGILILTVA